MKKIYKNLSKSVALILALLLLINSISTSLLVQADDGENMPTYNAYNEYSIEHNPNGVWKYQYRSDKTVSATDESSYKDMVREVLNGTPSTVTMKNSNTEALLALIIKSENAFGTSNTGGALRLEARNSAAESILTFTVPYSGTISLNMANGGVYTNGAGIYGFKVLHNGSEVSGTKVASLRTGVANFTGPIELTVNEGDTIRFVVELVGSYVSGVVTLLNPEITYESVEEAEPLPSYKAYEEYSVEQNPNGVWRYQYRSDKTVSATDESSYKDMVREVLNGTPSNVTMKNSNTEALLALMIKSENAFGTSNTGGALRLEARNSAAESILTFTAPYSGTISLNMANGGVYTNGAGVYGFKILHNGSEVSGTKVASLRTGEANFTGPIELTVNEGDTIRFVVELVGSYVGGVVTLLNPEITYKSVIEAEPLPTYNAVENFAVISNPNGVWGYQYRENATSTTFIDMQALSQTDTAWVTSTTGSVADINGSPNFTAAELVTGERALRMRAHNENAEAVLAFIAPYSGTIEVKMANGGVFAPYNSVDGVRFTMLHNQDVIMAAVDLDNGYNADGSRFFTGTQTLDVNEGDIIRFAIGRNAGCGDGRAFINPEIVYTNIEESEPGGPTEPIDPIEPIEPVGPIYNAVQEFNRQSNPNGVWTYQYRENSDAETPYLNLVEETPTNQVWANKGTLKALILKASSAVLAPTNSGEALRVEVRNTTAEAVLTFTAPRSGIVDIDMANGGVYVVGNGGAQDVSGFKMLHNDTVLQEKVPFDESDNGFFDKVENLTVKKGDVIRFVITKEVDDGKNTNTFFNPEIVYTSLTGSDLDLQFEEGKEIEGIEITKNSIKVQVPTAFGGSEVYSYTLYMSETPITEIPTEGGIDLGEDTTYTMENLSAYTNYYFAATVSDGEKTASIITTTPIATIGNTYQFVGYDDYIKESQPINTPWRYYTRSIETKELIELVWDAKQNYFGIGKKAPSVILKAVEGSATTVTGKEALQIHPEGKYDTIVAFIAPYSGKITIDAANGGVFTPANGAAQNYNGTNFTLLHGDKVLYEKKGVSSLNNQSDRCFDMGVSVEVKEGDVIYFVVNSNGSNAADSTYLNPRVTYTYVEKGSDDFGFLPGALVVGEDITENSFTVRWSEATGPDGKATGYRVWISTSPISSKPSAKPIYEGSKATTICTNLEIGRRYYFYIEATDATGVCGAFSFENYVRTSAPVYNAFEGFNTTNGADVWNYATRKYDAITETYVYELLKYNAEEGLYKSDKGLALGTAKSDLVVSDNVMKFYPDGVGGAATLVFTAPYSGEISLSMKNGGVFAPMNGEAQKLDGVSFTVLKGQEEIFKYDNLTFKNSHPSTVGKNYIGRIFTDSIMLTVKQGEKLYFIVGANQSNNGDTTFCNPNIEYLYITGGDGTVQLEGFYSENYLTYNAYKDFNTENGAGVWNYAYRSFDGGANSYIYTLMKWNEKDGLYGSKNGGFIKQADSDLVVGDDVIYAHPGSQGQVPVLAFTAPYSGNIALHLENGGVFCPANGEQQNYDGISFTVYNGTKIVFQNNNVTSKNNHPADKRVFTDVIKLSVKQGDKLFFVVEGNASNASDSTYFNPVIRYYNITGGDGKIALEGFVIPEEDTTEDKSKLVSFRENGYTDNTKVTGQVFGSIPEKTVAYVAAGSSLFALLGWILICLLNRKY